MVGIRKTVNICSKLITPPSDEGGGFCKAKDGGRENTSLPQSSQTLGQPPRQRGPFLVVHKEKAQQTKLLCL